MAPALPPSENGDLGMSPIYEQLSDKPPLAFVVDMGVRDMKHNRDGKLNVERQAFCGVPQWRRQSSARTASIGDRTQFVLKRHVDFGCIAPARMG